jgi:HK97 family phage portal protein
MGQLVGGLSPASGASGMVVYDMPSPGVIGNIVVNSFTTLQLPGYYRAHNFRSQNLASFPRSVRKNGADIKHRLDRLLKQASPNGYQSSFMFWRTLFFHQGHYANGFAEIERDSLFAPKALHNRQPEYVCPFRWIEDDGSITQWYHIGGMHPHIVAFADMIHLSGLSYDGFAGMNPVWLHYETFERSRLMDRYITRFLMKGSMVRGAVEIPSGVTDDQIATIINQLKKFKGADAEEDTLVLSGGATLSNKTLSNEQSQLIELHGLSTKQVAQLTDVPPHFLFDDSEGKYNANPQQAGEDVVRYLFRPLIEQAEDELLKLLSPQEQSDGLTINIDPSALTRGDVQTETANAVQRKSAGIIDGNEARNALGYPPSDDPEATKLKISGDTAPPKEIKNDQTA